MDYSPHSAHSPSTDGHEAPAHGHGAGHGGAAHDSAAHDSGRHDHSGHAEVDHTGHGHAAHGTAEHEHAGHGRASWRTAAQATLHCLTGCAIGEVLGMIIGTAAGLHGGVTVALSIALAFVFGYALTMRGVLKAGVDMRQALKVALAADTVSIMVMEVIDNTVMVVVPGAMDAGLATVLFWAALALSLALAFVLTVPINRWLIGKGLGHAVVHAYHH
ncbi:DUF4396 domain-containing protein [Microtetraspora malaysiensis]|uniref:DUF4396 domain-containing protein n=1 Tax=Microtetraspora malaysiensis TaxID=161358 RepID=UPI003D8CD803